MNINSISSISDQKLLLLAKRFGRNALLWRRKFIGLLPEINKRRLYEKKGYESIFVFAKKLAGLSEEQVRRALNLERRFEGFPALRKVFVNGEVSVNKLARVVSIATFENEGELAEKVKDLSKKAVETFVRDEKFARTSGGNLSGGVCENESGNESGNGFCKPKNGGESVPGHRFVDSSDLGLSKELIGRLSELKNRGIDVNEILMEALDRREDELEMEKEKISKNLKKTNSRYIPVKVKKVLEKEYGRKCSVNGCEKCAEVLHHTQTFALSRVHDPRFLAPLCKEHHEIAHSVNLKSQDFRRRVVLR